jgi:hypothetical protein
LCRNAALAAAETTKQQCAAQITASNARCAELIASAHAERDAALAARDTALNAQRLAECMVSNLRAERDQAVAGWGRAEAAMHGSPQPTAAEHYPFTSGVFCLTAVYLSCIAVSSLLNSSYGSSLAVSPLKQ